MSNKKRIYIIMITVFLTVGGLLILSIDHAQSSNSSSMQYFQEKYNASLSGSAKALSGMVVRRVKSLNIEDRCESCHLALNEFNRLNAAQPYKAHPPQYLKNHPPEKFGCTPCHGGNGKGLTVQSAHDETFLPGPMAQIRCASCHGNGDLKGSERVNHGRYLLKRKLCTKCHRINGLSDKPFFYNAPRLVGIGSKTTEFWLFQWLKNPQKMVPNAIMPRYQLDDKYIDALVGYLRQFKMPSLEQKSWDDYPEASVTAGKGLVRRSFCITCHAIKGKGGFEAMDLMGIGNRANPWWVQELLLNTHSLQPETSMPQYNFTRRQVQNIVAYLNDELFDDDLADQEDAWNKKKYWDDEAKRRDIGRRLYKELRCANCHGLLEENSLPWVQVGPDLTFIGSTIPENIFWGNSKIPHTLPDYLFQKIKNPQAFATKEHYCKMPQFSLTDHEIGDIVIALLSLTKAEALPVNYRARRKTTSVLNFNDRFQAELDKFRCRSCHSFKGIGHNITYDISLEGSRVTQYWLRDYLKFSYTLRPILTRRMPIFNMSEEEATYIARGIGIYFVDPEMKKAPDKSNNKQIEKGKMLFMKSGCQACHQLNGKGGYVGPVLNQGIPVGDKLTTQWLNAWFKDPQSIKPDTIEPNYGWSDEDRQACIAFLKSLSKKNTSNTQK